MPETKGKLSAAERLATLKEKVELSRAANTKAVEDELRQIAEREGASHRQRKRRLEARREAKERVKDAKRAGVLFVNKNVLKESVGDAERRVGCGRKRKGGDKEDGEGQDFRGVFGEDGAVRDYENRVKGLEKGRNEGVAGSESVEDVERLVGELDNVKKKRKLYSRRRPVHEDAADIAFINEKNRRFNDKLARTFDDYTAIIRDNLERGTALPDE